MDLEKLVTLLTDPSPSTSTHKEAAAEDGEQPSASTPREVAAEVVEQAAISAANAEAVDSLKISEFLIQEKKMPVKKKIYPRMLYYKTKVASNDRYRKTLKGRFQQLRTMLQPSETYAMKKPELMNRAIEHCSHLKKTYDKLKAENDALRAFIKREVDAEPQFLFFDNK